MSVPQATQHDTQGVHHTSSKMKVSVLRPLLLLAAGSSCVHAFTMPAAALRLSTGPAAVLGRRVAGGVQMMALPAGWQQVRALKSATAILVLHTHALTLPRQLLNHRHGSSCSQTSAASACTSSKAALSSTPSGMREDRRACCDDVLNLLAGQRRSRTPSPATSITTTSRPA
jgi:hypothetical protein